MFGFSLVLIGAGIASVAQATTTCTEYSPSGGCLNYGVTYPYAGVGESIAVVGGVTLVLSIVILIVDAARRSAAADRERALMRATPPPPPPASPHPGPGSGPPPPPPHPMTMQAYGSGQVVVHVHAAAAPPQKILMRCSYCGTIFDVAAGRCTSCGARA